MPSSPQPSIAILGASADRSKFGNKAIRAYLRQGFDVYPVNPKGESIEGLTTYRTLAEVPRQPLDRVSVYLPPAVGIQLLPQIQAAAPRELWLNPGSESPELVAAAEALGLEPIIACSIVDVGEHPAHLD